MQIASMNPAFLDKSNVDQATLDKEKEIQLALMANDPKMASKPEKVREGIVMGKMNKYYEENCLLPVSYTHLAGIPRPLQVLSASTSIS